MRRFVIEQSDADIVSHSGLALIGQALNKHSGLGKAVDNNVSLRHGIPHSDVLYSYMGLLCIGKSDCDAIENVRDDSFYSSALNIDTVPSAATLRQRMDTRANEFLPLVDRSCVDFLKSVGVKVTPLPMGHVPLDADVTPMDNSRTKKQGVSRTYKGMDGYAPMMGYIGAEGYCVAVELRQGKQHCQKGTPDFLRRFLANANEITDKPMLLRLDGGNDALANVDVVLEHNEPERGNTAVDFIIKWNPRKENPEEWLDYAVEKAFYEQPRAGKRVWVFDIQHERTSGGYDYSTRRVMRVIERTIDKHGQALLVPEIEMEGWWTSLDLPDQQIIDLYSDHGTSEQFHSEFKTDMDIERLPSGKFATNQLVLSCAALAYNILRFLGQEGLTRKDAPVRHKAKRRRIRTVMQELMYLAARFVESGRRWKLRFAYNCRAVKVFDALYQRLACT